MTPVRAVFALSMLALLAAGCPSADDPPPAAQSKPGAKPGPTGPAAERGEPVGRKVPPRKPVPFPESAAVAQLSGRVLFRGVPPKQGAIDISSKAECVALHGGKTTILDETVIVDVNDGVATVRNVFVFVSEGAEGWAFPVPEQPVVIEMRGCLYRPHVAGVRVGQKVEFRNVDPLTHNVHYFAAKHPEVAVSQGGGPIEVRVFNNEDEVFAAIKCDVHSWMKMYLGVLSHPFFAVSDERGGFRIPGKLPPGRYKLTAKHESGRKKLVEVEIAADGSVQPAKIEFVFERKDLTGG